MCNLCTLQSKDKGQKKLAEADRRLLSKAARLLDQIATHSKSRLMDGRAFTYLLSYQSLTYGRPPLTLPHLLLASENAPRGWVLLNFFVTRAPLA